MHFWKSSKTKKSSSKEPEIIRWPSFSNAPRAPAGYLKDYEYERFTTPLPRASPDHHQPPPSKVIKSAVPMATAPRARPYTTTNVRTQVPTKLRPLPPLPITTAPPRPDPPRPQYDGPVTISQSALSRSRVKNRKRERVPSRDNGNSAEVAVTELGEHILASEHSFEGMSDPGFARTVRKEISKARVKEGKTSRPKMGPRDMPVRAATTRR